MCEVRRSRLLPGKATVHDGWPITTAADTVLDLVAEMRSPHDVVALLTDACRSKSVTAEEILKAMGRRKRQRHRQLVKDVLADVVGGVESILEHRYLVKVERAHGCRADDARSRHGAHGVPICRDVDYDEFDTVVELDGRLGHEGSGRHRDRRRDNAGTVRRKATLRYGHADLMEPCEAAVEVATVLRDRGWTGQLTRCGPSCTAVATAWRLIGHGTGQVTRCEGVERGALAGGEPGLEGVALLLELDGLASRSSRNSATCCRAFSPSGPRSVRSKTFQ